MSNHNLISNGWVFTETGTKIHWLNNMKTICGLEWQSEWRQLKESDKKDLVPDDMCERCRMG